MTIVFSCPKCNHVMRAPDEKGGVRVKCPKCALALEVPYPKGKLIEVVPTPAAPALTQTPSKPLGPLPKVFTEGPKEFRSDDWLRDSLERKDAEDWEAAIKLLRRAYEEAKRERALYPVDIYIRLPLYLQQAGKMKDAWAEFNTLLFQGYPNQTKDATLIPLDRSKVLDKMRLFLELEKRDDIAAVYEVLSAVCKSVSLFRDNKKKELNSWFNNKAMVEFVETLKKYPGNLGKLQPMKDAIMKELGPDGAADLEKLGERLDLLFAKG